MLSIETLWISIFSKKQLLTKKNSLALTIYRRLMLLYDIYLLIIIQQFDEFLGQY